MHGSTPPGAWALYTHAEASQQRNISEMLACRPALSRVRGSSLYEEGRRK